jgi:predicted patatin/cPLA2 family phospholipase
MANPSEFHFPATNAVTGKAEYFSKEDLGRDDYRGIMATCALPGFCKPISFHGNYYYDGGVADSIPIERAIADGCDKVVIIYCRPLGYVKQPEGYRFLYKRMLKKFPNTITSIDNRHLNYRHSVEVAANLQKEGRAFLFAPSHQVKIGTFTTDSKIMQELYDLGISDYKAQKDALRAFLDK